MTSFKKCFYLIGCFVICLICSCCKTHSITPNPNYKNDTNNTNEEIKDENEIEITEPDKQEHSFKLVSQSNGTFTYRCADCNEEASFIVTCISGTQNVYNVEGNTLTFTHIDNESIYDIKGKMQGNIIIDVSENYKFELQMSGFEISSFSACPITILSGDKVTISAKKSTENFIYDMREKIDETALNSISAGIYSLCDLDLQGKGYLNIKSVNNNGIHTKDDLKVKNLSLQVDCKDNALKGNDSVTIESGNLTLIARGGDGIKTTNSDISSKGKQRGTITISGGTVLIYAACDGIDAAYDTIINESTEAVTLQIFTDKYSKYAEEVTAFSEDIFYVRYNFTAYTFSLKFYNDEKDVVWRNSSSSTTVGNAHYFPITKPNGYTYVQLFIYNNTQQQGQDENYFACTDGMKINSNYDTIALQSKNGRLTYGWTNYTTKQNDFGPGGMGGGFGGGFGGMNDGNTDKGDYSTKGIKANNAITISKGNITISSYDDAIHATISTSLENGISSCGNIDILDGNLKLCSNDDAIHADGKVTINGGTITIISSYEGIEGNQIDIIGGNLSVISNDDGINATTTSGTAITISGGNLYICAGGDGIDSNSTASYAGIVFSGGRSVIISTGQADSSIDTERGYSYSGGYVIGIGISGGMGNESTNCLSFSSLGTSKIISLQKGNYLVVDNIATIQIPVSINALVVYLGNANASISSSTTTGYSLDSNGVYWE
ncbi:MAG: carbohydrate-binding domain-containing protein [Anaeroplasma bactoclasticum]|nr:carbohydrate-binding domain-containing protein [Anaeroplasma bactoclasticum]